MNFKVFTNSKYLYLCISDDSKPCLMIIVQLLYLRFVLWLNLTDYLVVHRLMTFEVRFICWLSHAYARSYVLIVYYSLEINYHLLFPTYDYLLQTP